MIISIPLPTRRRTALFALVLASAFATQSACLSGPDIHGAERETEQTLTYEGRERRWLLHTPLEIPHASGKAPLLLALHGLGQTPEGFLALTRGRFNELGDERGFFVAYPAGYEKSWNDNRNDPDTPAIGENLDDVGFLREMIARIAEQHPVDMQRIYITGMSNGGFMSLRAACEMSDLIRGAAPVTAQLPEQSAECDPEKAMRLVMINGTADSIVPYDGGNVDIWNENRGEILSTESTIERFRDWYGCRPEPRTLVLPDVSQDDGSRAVRFDYDGCRKGGALRLLRIEGGGHTWPGAWEGPWPWLFRKAVGYTNQDFAAADEIVDYFEL